MEYLGFIALCVFFSFITYENQQPVGEDAAERLLVQIQDQFEEPGVVVLAGKNSEDGRVCFHLGRAIDRGRVECGGGNCG